MVIFDKRSIPRYLLLFVLIFTCCSSRAASDSPFLDSLQRLNPLEADKHKVLGTWFNHIEWLFWHGGEVDGDQSFRDFESWCSDHFNEVGEGTLTLLQSHRAFSIGRDKVLSMKHCRDAVDLLKQSGDSNQVVIELISAAYLHMGYIYEETNTLDKAFSCYLESKEIAESKDIPQVLIHALNRLSVMYLNHFGDDSLGLEYLRASLQLAEELGEKSTLATLNVNMANYHYARHNAEQCEHYLNTAIAMQKEMEDREGLAHSYLEMAKLKRELADYPSAREYVQMSLEKSTGSCYWCYHIHYAYAGIARQQGSLSEAKMHYLRALELAEEFENGEQSVDALFALARLAASQNEWEEASLYYADGFHQKDSIDALWKVAEVARMQTRYQLSEIEKEKAFLTHQKQLLDLKVVQQNKVLLLTVLILILVIGAGILLYISRTKIKSANRVLVEKNRMLIQRQSKNTPEKKVEAVKSASTDNKAGTGPVLNKTEAELVQVIENQLEVEEVFLKSDLTLSSFAQMLETNTSYLSNVINTTYKKSFSSLINEYRVQKVLHLFEEQEYKKLTIFGIAQKSGFKSKSAFHKAFTTNTGVTPTVYIRNMDGAA